MSIPEQPMTGKRKGLHPLAWVAIGCGALMLLGAIAIGGVTMFAAKKAKDFVAEAENNPVTATAKMIALMNPELEFVEANEEGREATFRNTKTGETVTISVDDMENGNFSMTTSDGDGIQINANGEEGSVSITADGETTRYESDGNSVKVTNDDGDTVLVAGGDVRLPGWLPSVPGLEPTGLTESRTGDGRSGRYSFSTQGDLAEMTAAFKDSLDQDGFATQVQELGSTQRLTAERNDGEDTFMLLVSQGEDGDSLSGLVAYTSAN